MADAPKPRRKDRPLTRKPGQPKRGPLPWAPTSEERARVELCVALGYTIEETALLLEKSVDSLERHCRKELDGGKAKIDAKVGAKFIDKCLKGDTACLIFYHKTRRGWRETVRNEHTGKDGGPIEYQNLSDEEIAARIATHEAARANGDKHPTTH